MIFQVIQLTIWTNKQKVFSDLILLCEGTKKDTLFFYTYLFAFQFCCLSQINQLLLKKKGDFFFYLLVFVCVCQLAKYLMN